MEFLTCPRCGDSSYEVLKSHAFCAGCNYSPDFERETEPTIPEWARKAVDDPQDRISALIDTVDATVQEKQPSDGDAKDEYYALSTEPAVA